MKGSRLRILNAEPDGYSAAARAILEEIGPVTEAPLSRAEMLAQLPAYDVLIVRLAHQIDRAVLNAGTRLKAVVSATTGLDHIDTEYAASKGVAVLSLRGETAFLDSVWATAEHTWALLLAVLRRIPQAAASVRAGHWDRDLFRGSELAGKRLGIVGLGRVGRKVARYGLAFGTDVAAYSMQTEPWVDGVARMPSLPALLQRSDVLSIHVPLNDETDGLIGARELELLPRGAVLVNTARGRIVDEAALVQALETGRLAAAALDVVDQEREAAARNAGPLLAYARRHDNLLITPHIAGATHESMASTEVFMARKLKAFLAEVAALSDHEQAKGIVHG